MKVPQRHRPPGLHFTPELLEKVRAMGVNIAEVTLHVGLGTFRPVKVEDVTQHHMHSEFYQVDETAANLINETRKNGGRIICVGTTSCRTIESAAAPDGTLRPCSGWTEIFIYPGYQFKVSRLPDHKLSSSGIYTFDAGVRPGRKRAHSGCI